MRRGLLLLAVAIAAVLAAAGQAQAAFQVGITSPVDGSHSLGGVVPVDVTASADIGIYSVQLYVDGTPYGMPDTTPIGLYQYEIPWDTSSVPQGDHLLSVVATDWSGASTTLMSSSVRVDVGPAYPTITLTSPSSWTFVHGSTPIQTTATSAVGPGTIALTVDGNAIGSPWNSAAVADGTHSIRATITDGRGKVASDTAAITVDNTAPETYVSSPSSNATVTASLNAETHASDAYGVKTVQFAIDATLVGNPITTASSPYTYSATLDVSTLAAGPHTLTSIAVDNAGNRTTSAATTFRVGTLPLGASITLPPDWSYGSRTVAVTAQVTGGVVPISGQLLVDNTPVGTPVTAAPYTFDWDTTKFTDGTHILALKVTDAKGSTATSAVVHATVDNTSPSATMYQPPANARLNGPTTFQVHVSDAYGVASVQFTVDGKPVGTLLTRPDIGQQYLYSITFDTATLGPGTHSVSAIVTDNAGNRTTAAAVAVTTGPAQYLPVLNFHEIAPPAGYSIYDQTPAQADQELAYLKANGYQSVTLDQYQQWLSGASIGVTKPVLITVDDGLKSELAWDSLLQKYGFKAVMFVITGYADNLTPGDSDPNNMSWPAIKSLANNGRWQIALHAGLYGHGDSYADGATIGGASYTTSCPYFYTCLSYTTTGRGKQRQTQFQSVASYKTAVTSEITNGIAELKSNIPSASPLAWAAPFNDAGQWTNLYNDPSGAVQSWFPGFMASKFPIVFTQTNPVTYAQASGTVGNLSAYNRRYRFEVHTDTTIGQFSAALADAAFAR
jgi:Big-like domain-containing protein/polysaccharide deacetylase